MKRMLLPLASLYLDISGYAPGVGLTAVESIEQLCLNCVFYLLNAKWCAWRQQCTQFRRKRNSCAVVGLLAGIRSPFNIHD